MIVSASLGIVPFLSNTDSTRLQMCGKQLNQCCTHPNCRRPYVIGNEYKYLTKMSKFYKYVAQYSGKKIYGGNGITIIFLNDNSNGDGVLNILETPKFKHCANGFATKLIYEKNIGDFEIGDILFEYDSFKEDVPSYGYNLNTAYMPWFGLIFEDAIVISESASNMMRTNKIENVIVPIYTHTLFRTLYPESKYGFIPDVGQEISDNVILYQSVPKDEKNKNQLLKSISLYDLTTIIEDNFLFNSIPIISKLSGGTLTKLKVHHINKILRLADEKSLGRKLKFMFDEYGETTKKVYDKIANIFGETYARRVVSNHYIMQKYGKDKGAIKEGLPLDIRRDDLVYVLELEITKEYKTKVGDKISNRYANKGVISQIIPDELRPVNVKTGEPIDVIISPLSVFNRMNFGQIIEGLLNKILKFCEQEILKGDDCSNILDKLVEISNALGNAEYGKEIKKLNNDISKYPEVKNKFIESIKYGGLFFEAPCFASFDLEKLILLAQDLFGISTNDSIRIPKETIERIYKELDIDLPLPKEDVIHTDIYNAPIYIIKLMQLAESKLNVRDFGDYSASKKQPMSDRHNLNKASKIGNMEFDALLAHNCMEVIKELRTVKSDATNLKSEMVSQLINTGVYDLPTIKPKSFTRDIITAYIKFLNEN